jgi:hypothetical protein
MRVKSSSKSGTKDMRRWHVSNILSCHLSNFCGRITSQNQADDFVSTGVNRRTFGRFRQRVWMSCSKPKYVCVRR